MSQSAIGRRWKPSSQRNPRGKNGLEGILVKSSDGPSRSADPRARASAVSSQNPSFSSSYSEAYDLSIRESPKKYPMPPMRLENKDWEKTSYFLLLNGPLGEKVCVNRVANDSVTALISVSNFSATLCQSCLKSLEHATYKSLVLQPIQKSKGHQTVE
jgi:hypothetical protein